LFSNTFFLSLTILATILPYALLEAPYAFLTGPYAFSRLYHFDAYAHHTGLFSFGVPRKLRAEPWGHTIGNMVKSATAVSFA